MNIDPNLYIVPYSQIDDFISEFSKLKDEDGSYIIETSEGVHAVQRSDGDNYPFRAATGTNWEGKAVTVYRSEELYRCYMSVEGWVPEIRRRRRTQMSWSCRSGELMHDPRLKIVFPQCIQDETGVKGMSVFIGDLLKMMIDNKLYGTGTKKHQEMLNIMIKYFDNRPGKIDSEFYEQCED